MTFLFLKLVHLIEEKVQLIGCGNEDSLTIVCACVIVQMSTL